MWSGASIPSGWYLCDGNNSTPDLRDRFIIGSGDTYSISNTGGSANAVVVSHSHGVTDPGHAHTIPYSDPGGTVGISQESTNATQYGTNPTNSANTGISIDSAGESGNNKNLPPYYALAFIMKA